MIVIETDKLDQVVLSNFTQELVYCGLDALLTQEIYTTLNGKLVEPYRGTYEWERRLLGPVMTMIRRGIKIDPEQKAKVIESLKAKITIVEANFKKLCHEVGMDNINYRSYVQLGDLFWGVLGIPKVGKVEKGQVKYSLDRGVMESLSKKYARAQPFANCILRMRDIQKTIDTLSTALSPEGRWHSSFNIGGTDTWRWSSSEHPFGWGANGQNITDELRRAFVADEGWVFFSCDQQGAEARLVGYLSGDENYIKALESGDVHTMVASMVFGFEPRKDLAERKYYRHLSYRDICKRIGHGSNYMGSPKGIADAANIDIELVKEFQPPYFKAFPGIPKWHVWTANKLQTDGFLDTPWGDRRHFWDRTWDDATLRSAVAFVPQSTIGQLTNRGLYNIWQRYEPEIQICNNGHDAAIGFIREDRIDQDMPRIIEALTQSMDVTDIKGVKRTIVIPWEASWGWNWGKQNKENPRGLRGWVPGTKS